VTGVIILGKDEDLSDMTEVVVSDMDLGLEEDTITTYWLSYDRFIGFPYLHPNRQQFLSSFTSLRTLENMFKCTLK
jgi:hypothetical protein